jgi:hypothetical protein
VCVCVRACVRAPASEPSSHGAHLFVPTGMYDLQAGMKGLLKRSHSDYLHLGCIKDGTYTASHIFRDAFICVVVITKRNAVNGI